MNFVEYCRWMRRQQGDAELPKRISRKRVLKSKWSPISTAPKDGTEILIRYPLQGNVKQLVSFDKLLGCWKYKGEIVYPESQGCEWHYMPKD